MQVDLSLGTLEVPWDPALNTMREGLEADNLANLRFWDERIGDDHFAGPGGLSPDPMYNMGFTDHPWWSHVDIKPKQQFGQRRNLWPALMIENHSDTDSMIVKVWLRMLVGR